MFKGKVYIYKNINGKEEKVEREFDNPEDFHAFSKSQNLSWPKFNQSFMGLNDWVNLQNYFDDLIDKRLWLEYDSGVDNMLGSDIVDLDKYEQELQKIEYQKQHKDENLKSLKKILQELRDYKKKFKDVGKEEMISRIDEDIKKVEEEIKNLEK